MNAALPPVLPPSPSVWCTDSYYNFACLLCADGYKTTYLIESEGHGATIEKGDRVTVHATGIVKETGKKFWSTKGIQKENAHINQPFFL